jgi:hypothetical protein
MRNVIRLQPKNLRRHSKVPAQVLPFRCYPKPPPTISQLLDEYLAAREASGPYFTPLPGDLK